MNVQVNQNERLIRPSDPAIRYTGRIDNSNPCLLYTSPSPRDRG